MREVQMSQSNELPSNHRPICADPVNTAHRELVTFINAVTELFGSSRPSLTEIWLDELALMDNPAGLRNCEWRLVTIAAVARLVSRLTGVLRDPNPTARVN